MNNKNPKLAISAIILLLLVSAVLLPSIAAKPDFFGVYEVATFTPFHRAMEFVDILFITQKQVYPIII